VAVRSDRSYGVGEEICVSYGQKTSGELLLSYGFVPGQGTNPYDAVLLSLDAGRGLDGAAKAAALRRRDRGETAIFPLRMGAFPDGFFEFAAFAAADAASEEDAESLARALFDDGGGGVAGLQGIEAAVKACRNALARYPRSLEADKAELEALQADRKKEGQDVLSRKEIVLGVLVRERQVLSRAIFLLQQELRVGRRTAVRR
jgi:hypothetical protein